jgi:hypothetical protein
MAVLSMSILVIVAALVRVVRIVHVIGSLDAPWDSYDVDIWCAVEINIGIFCASAPAVKPLLRQLAPGLLSSINTESGFNTNTRATSGKYGGGSRIRQSNAPGFELSSQTDLEFPPKDPKSGVNHSWIDFESNKKSDSDGDSERAIVDSGVKDGEIRKTVRVMVEDYRGSGRDDAYLARPNSVGKFEHV